MNVIDLRLNEKMEVVRIIPRKRSTMEKEFDYPSFPYICYDIAFDIFIGNRVHWNRNSTFEYIEVLRGHIELRTGRDTFQLAPGDLCFINIGATHTIIPTDAPSDCVIRIYSFSEELLCGNWENPMASKYVSPIQNNPDILCFCPDTEEKGKILNCLHAAQQAQTEKPFGYEFDIRDYLTQAWKILYLDIQPHLTSVRKYDDRLKLRMRTMLEFIRKNYDRKIDLDEIAASATVSQRECFRCFKSTMGITPVHYLQNFRIRMAARHLVQTDESISDIGQTVGFSDTSYFGKIFQKYMNCSPSEYRRRHRESYILDQDMAPEEGAS